MLNKRKPAVKGVPRHRRTQGKRTATQAFW